MDQYGDQIVPIADSALLSAKLAPKATLKVYEGLSHSMCTIDHDLINEDLMTFFSEEQAGRAAGQ